MTIRTSIPIWGRLYPDLLDVDKVMTAYHEGRNQINAAEVFGCCDRTFRKALKYHNIRPPIGRVPRRISRIFMRPGNPECQSEKLTDK